VKALPPLGVGREHPVDHDAVKVNVGVERRAEPVQEGRGKTDSFRRAKPPTGEGSGGAVGGFGKGLKGKCSHEPGEVYTP
jgi:hypothetical protein